MIDFIFSCLWNACKAIIGFFIIIFALYGFIVFLVWAQLPPVIEIGIFK